MPKNLVAKSSITIEAPTERVWQALTSPEEIKRYMFGAETETDWQVGSPITVRGEWEGKPFEDKGMVVENEPAKRLVYTHYSPLSGAPDEPENYHTVTYVLMPINGHTMVTVQNDNMADEKEQRESAKNWLKMLEGLKGVVEGG